MLRSKLYDPFKGICIRPNALPGESTHKVNVYIIKAYFSGSTKGLIEDLCIMYPSKFL